MSLAKFSGVLHAMMGLLLGAAFSFFAVLGAGTADAGLMGIAFGLGAIIILPIFYGVLGFLGGLVSAGLYNLTAKWQGGIEFDLKK